MKQEEDTNVKNSKWSMSTDDKSKKSTSGNFVDISSSKLINFDLDAQSLKNMHHKFDDVLAKTYGEVSIIMRIQTNYFFADRMLQMLKGLAEHIKESLDSI